ncbi:hypothetical protein F3J16_05825 [Burkholderia sp. Ap-962]|uniref:hypothetical protein n=1 Tax=Burkholderia sp. Ap-962 TaxID=2608333 RepID=UPI00141EF08D|nr:hypothetical protein [Burkholderia sp. Ap-962]NIF69711.1 hypothetical protein [Burkholderia sp. Ap-962]
MASELAGGSDGNTGAVSGEKSDEAITVAQFLEEVPPNQTRIISNLGVREQIKNGGALLIVFRRSELQLHCPNESCNGIRFFRCMSDQQVLSSYHESKFYVTYICGNCQNYRKVFSLTAQVQADDEAEADGVATKFGELPAFGPPVSPKLIKLIGSDREMFLKGRRCENQGLGVGAFVYYRRVLENQRVRILKEIVRVCEKVGVSQDDIVTLRAAEAETRFSESLNMAKDVIPQALLINGHSPLLLLHGALSEGLHAMSDEECLELASSIRVVLGELSDRMSQVLKDEKELTSAVSRLLQSRAKT